ncbi:unnamed protein product [Heterotrigona itama]|uniref:Uncharacterized protein n=1 Tax=Heterotrigona itama TaxID=395501 RepID=A0A6V7GTD1_9HYME|nr:unnamed protein product [Heterotrigona itama]
MGTVSIDARSVDASERRVQLGGSSHAARSSNEDPEPDESDAVGNEGRIRGALYPTSAEDQEGNGRRFPPQDAEPRGQILKLGYFPKGKRNTKSGKKSARCKRRVTFAL